MTKASARVREGDHEPVFAAEQEMAALWGDGLRGPLRLADGRALRVIFPGMPGRGPGPDYVGALLDAGGDLLRGDVEFHLSASSWEGHGHARDAAYNGVILHVVARNDSGAQTTTAANGRAIAILQVAPAPKAGELPGFVPPCALNAVLGAQPAEALRRISRRRLRIKAARAGELLRERGPGDALYRLALEQLAGSANREEFGRLAARMPLASLLERANSAAAPAPREQVIAAELRGRAAALALRRVGLRPLAQPGQRLDVAAALFSAWWPRGAEPGWPHRFEPGMPIPAAAGLGRSAAIELMVNAVLPLALAGRMWGEAEVIARWEQLPSPGTYGKLRRLESWLGGMESQPFADASLLQGGLLLQRDYCLKGMCGRCPLSDGPAVRRE